MDHTTLLLPKSWNTNWPLRTVVYSYDHLSYEYVANMFAYPYWKRKQALPKVERVKIGHLKKKKADVPLIWWPVVLPTPGSRFANVPFANVSFRSAKKRNERCAWICFVLSVVIQKSAICMCIPLSATDQAKAVGELTQHVRETTSEVGEQDVGETTRRRNDR